MRWAVKPASTLTWIVWAKGSHRLWRPQGLEIETGGMAAMVPASGSEKTGDDAAAKSPGVEMAGFESALGAVPQSPGGEMAGFGDGGACQ